MLLVRRSAGALHDDTNNDCAGDHRTTGKPEEGWGGRGDCNVLVNLLGEVRVVQLTDSRLQKQIPVQDGRLKMRKSGSRRNRFSFTFVSSFRFFYFLWFGYLTKHFFKCFMSFSNIRLSCIKYRENVGI